MHIYMLFALNQLRNVLIQKISLKNCFSGSEFIKRGITNFSEIDRIQKTTSNLTYVN